MIILYQDADYIPIVQFYHLFWVGFPLMKINFCSYISKKSVLVSMSTISVLCISKFTTVFQTYNIKIT